MKNNYFFEVICQQDMMLYYDGKIDSAELAKRCVMKFYDLILETCGYRVNVTWDWNEG